LKKAGYRYVKPGKLYGSDNITLDNIYIKYLFEKEFVPNFNFGDKNENIKHLK
jgi:hypothetical protein